jgi:hypothetical protein
LRVDDGGLHRGGYAGPSPGRINVHGPFEARGIGRLHDLVLDAPVFHQEYKALNRGLRPALQNISKANRFTLTMRAYRRVCAKVPMGGISLVCDAN